MDPLDHQVNRIHHEASQIPIQFLPGRVLDEICDILDCPATTSVRDYRGLGERLRLTPVHVRAIRANTNGTSVTNAILQQFYSTLMISDFIFILRQMGVGGVQEILDSWPETRRKYYRHSSNRPGVQNIEGSCRCQNCCLPPNQPIDRRPPPNQPMGKSLPPHQMRDNRCVTSSFCCDPSCPQLRHIQGIQDGVSCDLHGDCRSWDQRRNQEDTGQNWRQMNCGYEPEGPERSRSRLERNFSNEDNCSYMDPSSVQREVALQVRAPLVECDERQGMGGTCQKEAREMGHDTKTSARQERTTSAGQERTTSAGQERTTSAGQERTTSAGQERTTSAGQERMRGASHPRMVESGWEREQETENQSNELGITDDFLPPDDSVSLTEEDPSHQASRLPMTPIAQGNTGNTSSGMAQLGYPLPVDKYNTRQVDNPNHRPVNNHYHWQVENNMYQPVANQIQWPVSSHLHFHEQPLAAYPELRDNLPVDQTVRKMTYSTSEFYHQRHDPSSQHAHHYSLPPANMKMGYAAVPTQDVIEAISSDGEGQQTYQSQIKSPVFNQEAPLEEVVKMRESSRNQDSEDAREKRNSDPGSASSYSDLAGALSPPGGATQTGSGASSGHSGLRRQRSDELVYQRSSDISEATPEAKLHKFVLITGGEHQQGDKVAKEIWKLCKMLHAVGINVVADLRHGIVTLPSDPLATRRNMRHNINEAVHGYFEKATRVILAVSPGYRDYVDRHATARPFASPSSHHTSARFIYTQMMSEYCFKNFSRNKRFYPVILSKVGGRREHIPDWLTSTLIYTFPSKNSELVRNLREELEVET